MSRSGTRRGPAIRRGSTSILVLIIGVVITTVGLTAVHAQRQRLHVAGKERDGLQARLLAFSAIEQAFASILDTIEANPENWRDVLKDQVYTTSFGPGTLRWEALDSGGGSIKNDPDKPVLVRGTGLVGSAVHVMSVQLRPSGPGYSGLEVPLMAKKDLTFESGAVIQSDKFIATNDDAFANGASVFADVHAGKTINGTTYHGFVTPSAAKRSVPRDSHALEYYETNGTVIPIGAIPRESGDLLIEDVVLSPANNPFGDPNAEGIYIIDCDKDDDIIIRNVRIRGTLLIKDPKEFAEISGAVHWTPAVTHFPTLLFKGEGQGEDPEPPLRIGLSPDDLDEAARGVNFNPPGSAHYGEEDETNDDTYPSLIQGLIYADGDLAFTPPYTTIRGVVIGHEEIVVKAGAVLDLHYDVELSEDAPPGFYESDGGIRIGAFSWMRDVDG